MGRAGRVKLNVSLWLLQQKAAKLSLRCDLGIADIASSSSARTQHSARPVTRLYLAIVLDRFNREVIGWSPKPRMTTNIVADALTMAWFHRRPEAGVMHHSDSCSQYTSHASQDKLKEFGMMYSMNRNGNCWDSAAR